MKTEKQDRRTLCKDTTVSRYVIFQMAEVMVSKSLFHEILERISYLKPVPIGSG